MHYYCYDYPIHEEYFQLNRLLCDDLYNSKFLVEHFHLNRCETRQFSFHLSHLNFFKIGPTDFVLESMMSSEPSANPPNLSKAKAWNQGEMKGQKTEVHFYSLNINVFLFSKLIQQREPVRVSDEKIFRKFKIF